MRTPILMIPNGAMPPNGALPPNGTLPPNSTLPPDGRLALDTAPGVTRLRAHHRAAGTRAGLAVLLAWASFGCTETVNPEVSGSLDGSFDALPIEDRFILTEFSLPRDEGTPDLWLPDLAVPDDLRVPPPADGSVTPADGVVPADDARVAPADGSVVPADGPVSPSDAAVEPTDDAAPPPPPDGLVPVPDVGPPCVPTDELCDGLDNDCDGVADDDFSVGERCEGAGVCGAGRMECLDPLTSICSTEPEGSADESVAELCNFLDDDCDGEVDENPDLLGEACYTGPAGTAGVGLCHTGVRTCINGQLSAACTREVVPGAEICDGVDNDCDGRIDEDIVVEARCGTGVCRATSIPGACLDGQLRACQPGAAAADDTVCNGQDDDCDGLTDEEYRPNAQCGVGRCGAQAIASRCVGGIEQPCVPAPPMASDASCNGVDEDCNGSNDEDYRIVERCGVGVCQASSLAATCIDGQETACRPGPPTGNDSDCDALDDDCNGIADEAYVRVGDCGVGVCRLSETPSRCVAGVETACQPGLPFLADDAICDGLDSDCDGITDEDFTPVGGCGVGACAVTATPSTCRDGVETACRPGAAAPSDTTCDQRDDDCDGANDEDAPILAQGGEVRLTNTAGDSTRPQAVYFGAGYAAVWADNTSGRNLVIFARFDNNGVRIGAETSVTALPGGNSTPSIAWSGNRYAIVWQGTSGARPVIFLTLLDANGAVVPGATDVAVNQAFDGASAPRVLWNGADFLVFWQMGPDQAGMEIYSRRVTTGGVPQDQESVVSTTVTPSTAPAIIWNGVNREVGVVWSENEGAGNNLFNVFFARTNANGVRQGAIERLSTAPGNESAPAVGWNGTEYGVAWQDTRDSQDIWFIRVDARGLVQGVEAVVAPSALLSSAPSIAWNGTHWGIAWYDRRAGGNEEIFFARVTTPASPGPAFRLTNSAGTSFLPWLQWTGAEFGVFWYDNRDGNQEIYFARGPLGCP